ncbi:hypothetical protein V1515DRAFT_607048 [Lipomyces mesembrius]
MRGVVIKGIGRVAIQDYAIPVPGVGEVLLEMEASGLCGSDLRAIYRPEKPKSEVKGIEGLSPDTSVSSLSLLNSKPSLTRPKHVVKS